MASSLPLDLLGPTCNTPYRLTMTLLTIGSPGADSHWKVPRQNLFSSTDLMIIPHHLPVSTYEIIALPLTFPYLPVRWFVTWGSSSTTNSSGNIMCVLWPIGPRLVYARSRFSEIASAASTLLTGDNSITLSPCPHCPMASNFGGSHHASRVSLPPFAPRKTLAFNLLQAPSALHPLSPSITVTADTFYIFTRYTHSCHQVSLSKR